MTIRFVVLGFSLALAAILSGVSAEETRSSGPHAKVVVLDPSVKDYRSVLSGPPESINMKAGYVVLAPGKSVGKHTTGHHEELLVVLEGEGEMLFADGSKLPVKANSAVYCPPRTQHDITNTRQRTLRYVYVVSEAQ